MSMRYTYMHVMQDILFIQGVSSQRLHLPKKCTEDF